MFDDIIWSRAGLAAGFYGVLLGSLLWENRRPTPFNLVDLLMENGKASKWSVIIMTAFGLSCLYTTGWWITGNLSWGDFMAFCGVWVVPLIAKMFVTPVEKQEGS